MPKVSPQLLIQIRSFSRLLVFASRRQPRTLHLFVSGRQNRLCCVGHFSPACNVVGLMYIICTTVVSSNLSLSNCFGHFCDSTLSNCPQQYVFYLFLFDHGIVAVSVYCLSESISPGPLSSLCIVQTSATTCFIGVVLPFQCWDGEFLGTCPFIGSVQRIV